MGQSQSSPKQVRVVVIGETGSGKSSFLGFLSNMRAVLELGDAKLTLEKLKHLHQDASTERKGVGRGESQTDVSHEHSIAFLNTDLRVIDTPGFGDTRGLEQDKKNVQSIQDAIIKQATINAVVIVINGRNERMTPQFRYVLSQVTSILPKQILDQIVVVLTNVAAEESYNANFNVGLLTEFLTKPVDPQNVLYIENPYASVVNLISRAKTMPEAQKEKVLRGIKHKFTDAAEDVTEMCKRVALFKPLGVSAFKKLFDTKKAIEDKAHRLNVTMGNLAEKKKSLHEQTTKLAAGVMSVREVEHAMVTQLRLVDTGHVHMQCKACIDAAHESFKTQFNRRYRDFQAKLKDAGVSEAAVLAAKGPLLAMQQQMTRYCHSNCSIEEQHDKTDEFKKCQCFTRKTRKGFSIRNEQERQMLLSKLNMVDYTIVSTETQAKMGSESKLTAVTNFSIDGVEVRGDPEFRWVPKEFARGAINEAGWSMSDVKSRGLPFQFEMDDWSGMEKGGNMPCGSCDHVLMQHIHTRQRTEFFVEPTKKASELDELSHRKSTEQQQRLAVSGIEKELGQIESQEKLLKQELTSNLASFREVAVASSYIKLLNEQIDYLQTLIAVAKEEGWHDKKQFYESQLETIQNLRKSVETYEKGGA